MVCLLNCATPPLSIQLDCGQTVSVEAFLYDLTYSGLLEGSPNENLNAWFIEQALSRPAKLWGTRKVYMIPPTLDVTDPARTTLPRLNLHVWLTCTEPVDPMLQGSELVVTWFADESHTQPLADVISDVVRQLQWKQLARDFAY